MVPRVSEPPVAPTPSPPQLLKPLPAIPSLAAAGTRPNTPRRATAPESTDEPSLPTYPSISTLPYRPRPRSPFTRGHARSRSSGNPLLAPHMARAHSSPIPDSSSNHTTTPRSTSPFSTPGRHRSPMRKPSEESFSSFGSQLDIDQTISENSELDLTPRATTDFDSAPVSPSLSSHHTFPRSRRRPASPLNAVNSSIFTPKSTLRASTSTPSLAASQYNEAYPQSHSLSSSSISSTPTSLRSRSPSISSLETIPDSPDAEREAESIARLKAAVDREAQSEEGARRRMGDGGRVGRDKRKRWSVCGAERRGDLDLETIWED